MHVFQFAAFDSRLVALPLEVQRPQGRKARKQQEQKARKQQQQQQGPPPAQEQPAEHTAAMQQAECKAAGVGTSEAIGATGLAAAALPATAGSAQPTAANGKDAMAELKSAAAAAEGIGQQQPGPITAGDQQRQHRRHAAGGGSNADAREDSGDDSSGEASDAEDEGVETAEQPPVLTLEWRRDAVPAAGSAMREVPVRPLPLGAHTYAHGG